MDFPPTSTLEMFMSQVQENRPTARCEFCPKLGSLGPSEILALEEEQRKVIGLQKVNRSRNEETKTLKRNLYYIRSLIYRPSSITK